MTKLPESLFLIQIKDQLVWRIHKKQHVAIYYGKSNSNRFDDPKEGFGVLYLAENIEGAFVETILRQQHGISKRIIEKNFIDQYCISNIILENTYNFRKYI